MKKKKNPYLKTVLRVTTPDDALIDDIYVLGLNLGIKAAAIKDAVERTDDLKALWRRWRNDYKNAERRISAKDDRVWADKNAEEANERHRELQRLHADSRRATREKMTLGSRLDALMASVVTEPGPGVTRVGDTPVRSSGDAGHRPPDPAEFRSRLGMTPSAHWLWILRHIEQFEEDWDEFMGRGPSKSWATATSDEKDREIIKNYRGVHAREVAMIAPWLGSRRKIESVRAAAKLVPSTGEPKPVK